MERAVNLLEFFIETFQEICRYCSLLQMLSSGSKRGVVPFYKDIFLP